MSISPYNQTVQVPSHNTDPHQRSQYQYVQWNIELHGYDCSRISPVITIKYFLQKLAVKKFGDCAHCNIIVNSSILMRVDIKNYQYWRPWNTTSILIYHNHYRDQKKGLLVNCNVLKWAPIEWNNGTCKFWALFSRFMTSLIISSPRTTEDLLEE